MERNAILLCSAVGFLGLLSAATGFGAEATKIKGSDVVSNPDSLCEFPRSPAMALGLTSAVALMIAHVIINVATGCICCSKTPRVSDSNWTVALFCFVLSWFTFILAFLLLLTGAALNDQHGKESMYFGSYYCYVVKPGVFAGGSIMSLASVVFGIVYYLTLTKAKKSQNLSSFAPGPHQGGIAMGQPQLPTQTNNEPVFVHEDTYMRRQFT